MSCFRGAAQQGLQGLPAETMDAIAAHLSTKEKISLACSCKALWFVGSNSTSWWHTLALDPAAGTILEQAGSWWPQHKLVLQLAVASGWCSLGVATSVLQALAEGSLLSIKRDMGGSPRHKRYDLGKSGLERLATLQSLELSCDAPDWESLFGQPEDMDYGTPLNLSQAFCQLASLTCLKASGFSSLRWQPGCLPPGLRSLSVAVHLPPLYLLDQDANSQVECVGRAASNVSALQSLSIVVKGPTALQLRLNWCDRTHLLELAALRDPWARQLTQLSLIAHGRALDLGHLAGLNNLEQLRLGAGYLPRDRDLADGEDEEGPGLQLQLWQPLAPLGALTKLQSVSLHGMGVLGAEKLQPVWSLPLLQELDVASLHGLEPSLPQYVLGGCVAQRLTISLRVAALLGPMLGPLLQLEQLTVAGAGFSYGYPTAMSRAVLKDFTSHCPKLRKVEWLVGDGVETMFAKLRQKLVVVLPAGVELMLRVVGPAYLCEAGLV